MVLILLKEIQKIQMNISSVYLSRICAVCFRCFTFCFCLLSPDPQSSDSRASRCFKSLVTLTSKAQRFLRSRRIDEVGSRTNVFNVLEKTRFSTRPEHGLHNPAPPQLRSAADYVTLTICELRSLLALMPVAPWATLAANTRLRSV